MNNKFIEEFLLDQTIRIYEGLRTHLINEGINDEDTEELTENTEETQKLLEDVNDKVSIIMDALGLENKTKEDKEDENSENDDNKDTDVFMVPDDNDENGNIFTVPAMDSVNNNDNEIAEEPGGMSPNGESLIHGGRYILNLYSSDGRVKIKENLLFNSLSRLLDYNNNGLFPMTYTECERVLKRDRVLSSGKLFTNSRVEIIKTLKRGD